MGDDGVNAGGHAGEAAAGHLVDDDGFVPEITAAAAVFLWDVSAEYAEFAGAAPDVAADAAALAGGFIAGLHLGFNEAGGGRCERI
jgi:hypothetical protein